jgi:hypothetical protein
MPPPVSGLAKLFLGGLPAREQRPVAPGAMTPLISNLAVNDHATPVALKIAFAIAAPEPHLPSSPTPLLPTGLEL